MAAQKQNPQPDREQKFVQRIWHVGAKKYLYAKDYGIKGFPIRGR